MSENRKNPIIAIMNDYPPEKYNLLVPMKTMQEFSDMYKTIYNEVQIDTNPDNGDVYVQTPGYKDTPDKMALTQKGLAKLMIAAGISIIDSHPIQPSTVANAIAMAKAIGKIVPFDPRDTAHKVTIAVPEPSGGYQTITKQAEMIVEDMKNMFREQKKNMKVWENKKQRPATEEEKKVAVEKQLTQIMMYRRQQCETKALNRALRTAMTIKSTYTEAELKKPFVVCQTVKNPDNPDMKKIMLENYKVSTACLFGGHTPKFKGIEALHQNLQEAEIIQEEKDKEIQLLDQNENPDDAPIKAEPACEECGQIIQDGTGKWTVERIVAYSKEHFNNKILCIDCQNEARKEAKQ